MKEVRYWIGVVSREHVERGVEGGFAQLCHGKAAPLKRMQPGDWLVYYSPRTSFRDGEPCQSFTAIGRVKNEEPYEFVMSADFVPFRRDIDFLPCTITPIQPLLDQLSFITDKRHWGYLFRRGHFAIPQADFEHIAAAMGVEMGLLEGKKSKESVERSVNA
ncbi:MAG: EVE domain-containing protein [Ktedonobacteraceae bacterium]|nr:EVE domain-containing protein [Ktedonobacteraceae bacterium]